MVWFLLPATGDFKREVGAVLGRCTGLCCAQVQKGQVNPRLIPVDQAGAIGAKDDIGGRKVAMDRLAGGFGKGVPSGAQARDEGSGQKREVHIPALHPIQQRGQAGKARALGQGGHVAVKGGDPVGKGAQVLRHGARRKEFQRPAARGKASVHCGDQCGHGKACVDRGSLHGGEPCQGGLAAPRGFGDKVPAALVPYQPNGVPVPP